MSTLIARVIQRLTVETSVESLISKTGETHNPWFTRQVALPSYQGGWFAECVGSTNRKMHLEADFFCLINLMREFYVMILSSS